MATDDTHRLTKKIPNRYLLSLAVSERARHIHQEALTSLAPLPEDPVSMALNEVDTDRLGVRILDDQLREAIEEE